MQETAIACPAPGALMLTPEQCAAGIKATMGNAYYTIGVYLITAKAQLGRGEWLEWLRGVDINVSTADKIMQYAREIPQEGALGALPMSKAMALLPLPAAERESFAQEHGDKSVREIKRLLREKEAAEKERDQLRRERDEARENWNTYQGSAIHWKQEADYRAQRIEELQNAAPRTVKVVEVPDDYQALKSAAARHQAEMEDACQAAEDAEARAQAAERELARLRMQGGGQGSPGRVEKADRAAKDFLIAAQLLPYDPEAMGSAEARKQCELIMRPIRAWVMDMQQALEFGALDAEGAVV